VLSSNNTAENLTWVGKQKNLSDVLEILRVVETTLRVRAAAVSPYEFELMLTIAQYIATGKVNFEAPVGFPKEDKFQKERLASYLLETFTVTKDEGTGKLVGGINVLVTDKRLSEEGKKRAKWILEVFELRDKYRGFRDLFVDSKEADQWHKISDKKRKSDYDALLRYLRPMVVSYWTQNPQPHFREEFFEAFQAWSRLHPEVEADKAPAAFCAKLEEGLKALAGARGLPDKFVEDCRFALRMSEHRGDKEKPLRLSLREHAIGTSAHALLGRAIADESKEANMTPAWLKDRGRFSEIYKLIDYHLKIELPLKAGDPPKIGLDVPALEIALNVAVDGHLTERREYILATLAVLRRLFGESGSVPATRVFWDGEFRSVPWQLSAGETQELRDYIEKTSREFRVSQKHSDTWLPLAEGGLCLAGGIGLGLGLGSGLGKDSPGLRDGLMIGGSGAMGAGCGALAGHYLWPKLSKSKVRNHYIWDGLTGAGGALVGVGLYFLVRSIAGDRGSPVKYPVDEYGP
ncbi:MAG: hypothetical protein IT572_08660, partial [Deltaproteobacteria bacterium]|nr:hypothetical protein [Deltaproteobacteria bacterium]